MLEGCKWSSVTDSEGVAYWISWAVGSHASHDGILTNWHFITLITPETLGSWSYQNPIILSNVTFNKHSNQCPALLSSHVSETLLFPPHIPSRWSLDATNCHSHPLAPWIAPAVACYVTVKLESPLNTPCICKNVPPLKTAYYRDTHESSLIHKLKRASIKHLNASFTVVCALI